MKFLGDTKAETTADAKVIWLILPRGCRRPLSTASSSPASPCSHSTHSITLGFPSPGQSSVSSTSYSAYSVFPSPLLRPRGPTRKCRHLHLCKVPSLSLSGSSFLGPCWNRVDGNQMGTFWRHWLTWCYCSLLLVQMDWSEIPPDWQVFLLRAYPGDFPGHSQVGDPQIHSFLFNRGECSGTHSSPPAVVTRASLFPSLCKHHLEKIKQPTVSCLLADPQETHVS